MASSLPRSVQRHTLGELLLKRRFLRMAREPRARAGEREKERALVAQMQVKQALNSSELMFSLTKQKAIVASE